MLPEKSYCKYNYNISHIFSCNILQTQQTHSFTRFIQPSYIVYCILVFKCIKFAYASLHRNQLTKLIYCVLFSLNSRASGLVLVRVYLIKFEGVLYSIIIENLINSVCINMCLIYFFVCIFNYGYT